MKKQSLRRSYHEEKKKLRIVLIVLASLFVLYLIPSLYVGCRINKIILQSYDSFGLDNPYPETLSDISYWALHCRHDAESSAPSKKRVPSPYFPADLFLSGRQQIYLLVYPYKGESQRCTQYRQRWGNCHPSVERWKMGHHGCFGSSRSPLHLPF